MTLKKKFQRHLLIERSRVRAPGSPPKKRPSWSFFLLPGAQQRLTKSLPLLRKANPGQVQVTNFQFEPFGICLPLGMRLILRSPHQSTKKRSKQKLTSFCHLKLILNFAYVGIFYFKNIVKNIKFVKFMNYNYNSLFFLQ